MMLTHPIGKKIKKLICVLLSMLAGFVWSDSAPMDDRKAPGSTVIPINNNVIQLKSELIEAWLSDKPSYNWRNHVRVTYVFVNTSTSPQKLTMGFPNADGYRGGSPHVTYHPIENYHFFEGKEEISRREIPAFRKSNEQTTGFLSEFNYFECSEVSFKPNEEKVLVSEYDDGYNGLYFRYVLRTGSLWKGVIEKVDVAIHLDLRIAPEYYAPRTMYSYGDDLVIRPIKVGGFQLNPAQHTMKDNTVFMQYKNIEPDFDIFFQMNAHLLADNSFYNMYIFDEDPDTYVDLEHGRLWQNNKYTLIRKINGQNLFVRLYGQNGEIRKLARMVSLQFENPWGFSDTVVEMQRSPMMQEVIFKRPVFTRSVDIKCLEYYDDAEGKAVSRPLCLSEFTIETIEKEDYLKYGGVTVRETAIHEATNPYSPKLAALPKGSRVVLLDMTFRQMEIDGEKDYWFKVRTSAGKTGWIFGAALDVLQK